MELYSMVNFSVFFRYARPEEFCRVIFMQTKKFGYFLDLLWFVCECELKISAFCSKSILFENHLVHFRPPEKMEKNLPTLLDSFVNSLPDKIIVFFNKL